VASDRECSTISSEIHIELREPERGTNYIAQSKQSGYDIAILVHTYDAVN
jgi:hypothetical protein